MLYLRELPQLKLSHMIQNKIFIGTENKPIDL